MGSDLKPLDPDMPSDQLRLHMGELTPDEVLVARAAIRWANKRSPSVNAELLEAVNGVLDDIKRRIDNIGTVDGYKDSDGDYVLPWSNGAHIRLMNAIASAEDKQG